MDRITKQALQGYTQDCTACPERQSCMSSVDCIHALTQRLGAYEDTGLLPEEIQALQGEMVSCYADDGNPYLVEATGNEAKRIMELTLAESQGRLLELPCRIGGTLYIIVTKRPKITMPEFSFVKQSQLTFHNMERVLRDFGKTVFLTRKEADAALEKMKEDQNGK